MKHQFNKNNSCPICDETEFVDFIQAKDHNVSHDYFNITKCTSCGFKYTNPRPTENTIGKYYKSEEYISHSRTKKGLINIVYHIVRNYQLKNKEKLIKSYSQERKLLDIGCGTGEFLNKCKDNGWDTSGIETDADARILGKKSFGLSIGDEKDLFILPKNTFSVVTMWHVLEHVYNLKDYLNKINEILQNRGVLFVAVPNCESYDAKYYNENWAAYDLPIHLYHFRKKDILSLAEQTGFKIISIHPLLFDSFYISLLSEKKKKGFFINALIVGLLSNIKGKRKKNHSSLIYVLEKSN